MAPTIFSRFDKQHLLGDILASIARLSSSKRGIPSSAFHLSADQSIQILTALVLIRCVLISLHNKLRASSPAAPAQSEKGESAALAEMDAAVVVATWYDTAVRTAYNFLSVFLGRFGVKNQRRSRLQTPLQEFRFMLVKHCQQTEIAAAVLLFFPFGTFLV